MALRAQNFAQCGVMINQDLALNQLQFDQQLNQVISGQQLGVQLGQAGIQSIEQRNLFKDNHGPGSVYQKLMNAQVNKETEATNVLKKVCQLAVTNCMVTATE